MDHLSLAELKRIAIYANMTPLQKWQEALKLMAAARNMKRAFLSAEHPDWTSDQVETELRRIFLYAST